jgi:hypothetical protein
MLAQVIQYGEGFKAGQQDAQNKRFNFQEIKEDSYWDGYWEGYNAFHEGIRL